MPEVTLDARVPGTAPRTAFDRLADFAAYPRYTDAVREVTITDVAHGVVASHWSVNFRNGVLCWSEHDRIDPQALTIEFAQVEGDFDTFTGAWLVAADGTDVLVRFTAAFDLGMPSLAAIIDPVACRALAEAITRILHGLFGEHVPVTEPAPAGASVPLGT
ncbi:type II toxin-antitoxin system RatA family toxin [Streptomyces sp. NPDC017979]|uniref:type II toxin-antitoxin system RatA family toxin n=1 Tax=Streptomyces sp. NPDC017979 TaxID=3365024 RepID=UPI00379041B3